MPAAHHAYCHALACFTERTLISEVKVNLIGTQLKQHRVLCRLLRASVQGLCPAHVPSEMCLRLPTHPAPRGHAGGHAAACACMPLGITALGLTQR